MLAKLKLWLSAAGQAVAAVFDGHFVLALLAVVVGGALLTVSLAMLAGWKAAVFVPLALGLLLFVVGVTKVLKA